MRFSLQHRTPEYWTWNTSPFRFSLHSPAPFFLVTVWLHFFFCRPGSLTRCSSLVGRARGGTSVHRKGGSGGGGEVVGPTREGCGDLLYGSNRYSLNQYRGRYFIINGSRVPIPQSITNRNNQNPVSILPCANLQSFPLYQTPKEGPNCDKWLADQGQGDIFRGGQRYWYLTSDSSTIFSILSLCIHFLLRECRRSPPKIVRFEASLLVFMHSNIHKVPGHCFAICWVSIWVL